MKFVLVVACVHIQNASSCVLIYPQVKPVAPAPAPVAAQTNGRPQRRINGGANSSGAPVGSTRGPSSRPAPVPDNQQIFVGGLNSSMTEDEIKAVFSCKLHTFSVQLCHEVSGTVY